MPTGGEIDMSLSFNITNKRPQACVLFMASKAMPALKAPSPITAMAWLVELEMRAACANPRAAEMEVLECAVPK
ncbi:hypothetical protein D9M68_746370 [compost metagenome]